MTPGQQVYFISDIWYGEPEALYTQFYVYKGTFLSVLGHAPNVATIRIVDSNKRPVYLRSLHFFATYEELEFSLSLKGLNKIS
jgi:hypothetical protein